MKFYKELKSVNKIVPTAIIFSLWGNFRFLKIFSLYWKNMSTCFVFLMKNVFVVDILPLRKYIDLFFSHFQSYNRAFLWPQLTLTLLEGRKGPTYIYQIFTECWNYAVIWKQVTHENNASRASASRAFFRVKRVFKYRII